MANVYAVAGGDWNSDIWATAPAGPAVPGLRPSAGDVALANGQQVAIAADATVAAFRADAFAGAADGGSFDATGANEHLTLTGDLIPGQYLALAKWGGGALTINGDVAGGADMTAMGVSSNVPVTVNGSVTGGAGDYANGVRAQEVVVNGPITGGAGANAFGVAGGRVTVTGPLAYSATGTAPVFGVIVLKTPVRAGLTIPLIDALGAVHELAVVSPAAGVGFPVVPPTRKALVIYQGATFRDYLLWTLGPSKAAQTPVPFPPGTTARAHVRRQHGDAAALFRFSTEALPGEGRITLHPASGRIDLEMADEITAALPKQRIDGVWDLEIAWANGDVCRLVNGAATIDPEATHD